MDQKWGKPKLSSTVGQGSMRALIMVLEHPIGGPEEEMLPGESSASQCRFESWETVTQQEYHKVSHGEVSTCVGTWPVPPCIKEGHHA